MRIRLVGWDHWIGFGNRRNREENAQVATILPGKNFPCAGKSKSIRRPTS